MENYLGKLIPSTYRAGKTSKKRSIPFLKKQALKLKLRLDIKLLVGEFLETFSEEELTNDLFALNGVLASISSYQDEDRLRSAVSHLNYVENYELYIIIAYLMKNKTELLPQKSRIDVARRVRKLQEISDLYLKAFVKARFLYVKIEIEEDKNIIERAVADYLELLA